MKYFLYITIPLLLLFSCKGKQEWVHPITAPVTEAVFASGHIEPVEQFVLTSVNEGYLQQALVKESDLVETGQVLFILDHEPTAIEEDASLKNLQLAIQNASPDSPTLQKLQSDLTSAQEKLSVDSLQYIRMQRLAATNSVSRVDFENARLNYEHDINTVRSLEENIRATKLSLQQSLIQARSQYEASAAQNDYYAMKSPGNFRVYQIFKKQGELIRKGEQVALLGRADSLCIVLMVDEAGIAKIKKGQQVLVELNTNKGSTLSAHIARIYPYFDSTTQSYKVEAYFDKMADGIIAGTLLQSNIIVDHKEKALLIPRSSMNEGGKIILKKGKEADTVSVDSGIISTEWVEVKSGLKTSDKVLKDF